MEGKYTSSKRFFLSPRAWRSLGIIVLAASLMELITAIQYYYTRNILEEELEQRVLTELKVKTFALKQVLNSAELTLQEHVWDIRRSLNHSDSTFEVSRRLIMVNDHLVGSCLAFAPYYYPERGRIFEPYAYKQADHIEVTQLAGKGDHDYTTHPAFIRVITDKRPFWSAPYKYNSETGEQSLTTYSYPLLDQNGEVIVVCGLDVSLSWLGDTLNAHRIYPSSFGLFLTPDNQLIAGPLESQVSKNRVNQVLELITDSTSNRMPTNSNDIKAIKYYDKEKGEKAYIYMMTMKQDPHWRAALVCYDKEAYGQLDRLRLLLTLLLTAGFVLIGFIIYRTIHSIIRLQKANFERHRIGSELQVAKHIQKSMLPASFSPFANRQDVDIYGMLVPAREVGGDLFDYFLRDEKLFFCIGDVSGKGVPSAMVMAQTHSLFRMASAHENNPSKVMQAINEISCQHNESNMFVTFFIGVLDLPTGRLHYCNAGHDRPVLISSTFEQIPVEANIPLGVFEDFTYKEQQVVLDNEAMLFLYTDGLTEAMDASHQQFGISRVLQQVKLAHADCQSLIHEMTEAVHRFVLNAEQSDDLTMLAISYHRKEQSFIVDEHLTLEADVRQTPQLNAFVKDVCVKIQLENSLVRKLRLSVEEAVVNVMSYAYQDNHSGKIVIEAKADNHALHFVIKDWGVYFDPTKNSRVDTFQRAEDRPIGGLGILLMREMMDSVNYERIDDCNVLTLSKIYN